MTEQGRPHPFTVNVDQHVLDQLAQKLTSTRLPKPIAQPTAELAWIQGPPVDEIHSLVEHWQSSYDWRQRESGINAHFKDQQYLVDVDLPGYGVQTVHYCHVPSTQPPSLSNGQTKAIPILLIHGWPGSFLEYRTLAKTLSQSAANGGPAFDVVIPSLPGFGFSSPPTGPMQGPFKIAELFDKLMVNVLGYQTYASQGGDWGSFISRSLAIHYPQRCKAVHCTMLNAPKPSTWDETTASESDKKLIKSSEAFLTEQPYLQMNARTPQTYAFALSDSPVGLLGLFYEKLASWVDARHYTFSKDDVLDAVMMHWINGPESGIRLYQSGIYSNEVPESHNISLKGKEVKLGCSVFHKELIQMPRSWIEEVNDVVFWKQRDVGGHFPQVECPHLLAQDLFEMFSTPEVKSAFGM